MRNELATCCVANVTGQKALMKVLYTSTAVVQEVWGRCSIVKSGV